MIHEEEAQAIQQKIADRRAFLKSAGFTGLGLAGAGILAAKMGALEQTSVGKALGLATPKVLAAEDIDVAVLNFAMNLEYLEAEFYCIAAFGKRLEYFGGSFAGSGTAGPTTGGAQVDFTVPGNSALTSQLTSIAQELAYHEISHTKLLRTALGSSVVAKPEINLGALGIGFANYSQFLTLARAFEDTGLSAYNGAAALITSKAYLSTAVQIALTESNHSGIIRYLCALLDVSVPKTDSLDVLPPPAGTSYAYVTAPYSLAVTRTTDQVLGIVYGNGAAGTTKGGFFPNGMNGAISTIS